MAFEKSNPEKRIYCVVAQTVQTFTTEVATKSHLALRSTESTRTVVQPAGRLIAQAAHVISKVRIEMLVNTLIIERKPKNLLPAYSFEPITTIILSARDSYELYHVLNLLNKARLSVHSFYDFNQPDYGSPTCEVMTSIATEPVDPAEVLGILDYLPLWKP